MNLRVIFVVFVSFVLFSGVLFSKTCDLIQLEWLHGKLNEHFLCKKEQQINDLLASMGGSPSKNVIKTIQDDFEKTRGEFFTENEQLYKVIDILGKKEGLKRIETYYKNVWADQLTFPSVKNYINSLSPKILKEKAQTLELPISKRALFGLSVTFQDTQTQTQTKILPDTNRILDYLGIYRVILEEGEEKAIELTEKFLASFGAEETHITQVTKALEEIVIDSDQEFITKKAKNTPINADFARFIREYSF